MRSPHRWRWQEITETARGGEVTVIAAPDTAIPDALRRLGRCGLFVEPTSAVVLAGFDQLSADAATDDASTVLILTATGLKTVCAAARRLTLVGPQVYASLAGPFQRAARWTPVVAFPVPYRVNPAKSARRHSVCFAFRSGRIAARGCRLCRQQSGFRHRGHSGVLGRDGAAHLRQTVPGPESERELRMVG